MCTYVVIRGQVLAPSPPVEPSCLAVQMQPQPQGLRSLNQPTLTKLLAAPPPEHAQPKPNQALANVKGVSTCGTNVCVCVCASLWVAYA